MAQRYEVEAWVNPRVWDDHKQAEAVIDAIMASGSDDEFCWVMIARSFPSLSFWSNGA